MKRNALSGVCLLALFFSVGCCYRPVSVDPMTGLAYGGVWEPACAGPLDPLGFWCWVSGGRPHSPWNQYGNQYGGYPDQFGNHAAYGYPNAYPPGAIPGAIPGTMPYDPNGCGNVYPTFEGQMYQGPIQGPIEYGYPPIAPPTEREDSKEGKTPIPADSTATTHYETSWAKPVTDGAGVVAH